MLSRACRPSSSSPQTLLSTHYATNPLPSYSDPYPPMRLPTPRTHYMPTPHSHRTALPLPAEFNLSTVYKQQREVIMGTAGTGRIRVPRAATRPLSVEGESAHVKPLRVLTLFATGGFSSLETVSGNKTVNILLTVYLMKSQCWNERT